MSSQKISTLLFSVCDIVVVTCDIKTNFNELFCYLLGADA